MLVWILRRDGVDRHSVQVGSHRQAAANDAARKSTASDDEYQLTVSIQPRACMHALTFTSTNTHENIDHTPYAMNPHAHTQLCTQPCTVTSLHSSCYSVCTPSSVTNVCGVLFYSGACMADVGVLSSFHKSQRSAGVAAATNCRRCCCKRCGASCLLNLPHP